MFGLSKYCIYLRKSRADLEAEAHGEGETLSRHKTALLELARRMGITISATYEEIVSGETIAARPQMQRLLSEVGAGEWDGRARHGRSSVLPVVIPWIRGLLPRLSSTAAPR